MIKPRPNFIGKARTFHQDHSAPIPELGPLQLLPGTWKSTGGSGWNLIALPFSGGPFNYRLLLNRYDETLNFTVVGTDIPNRGIGSNAAGGNSFEADQSIASLDYQQDITQIAASDEPASGMAGGDGLAIHHEPGLWLYLGQPRTEGLDIARLASVPHGDTLLAMGTHEIVKGAPSIPAISGLPLGITDTLDSSYLEPYKHFHDAPFQDIFDPTRATQPLQDANQGVDIVRTTLLPVDSTVESAGIVNLPFIKRQANATTMRSTFWIQELAETDEDGDPKLRLQYAQTVMLDFFPRNDGHAGLIQWPHISINTLDKVCD